MHMFKFKFKLVYCFQFTQYLGHGYIRLQYNAFIYIQGKPEGFHSCDRPSNRTQIGLKLSIFQPV